MPIWSATRAGSVWKSAAVSRHSWSSGHCVPLEAIRPNHHSTDNRRRGHTTCRPAMHVSELHQNEKGGRIDGIAADVKCQTAEFARWCVPGGLMRARARGGIADESTIADGTIADGDTLSAIPRCMFQKCIKTKKAAGSMESLLT